MVHQAVSVPADCAASPDGCQPGCQQRPRWMPGADIGRISHSHMVFRTFSRTCSCYCSSTTYTLLIIPVSLLSGCLPHHSFWVLALFFYPLFLLVFLLLPTHYKTPTLVWISLMALTSTAIKIPPTVMLSELFCASTIWEHVIDKT